MGIAPSEFWRMTLQEFYKLYDTIRARDPGRDYAGSLSERDCDHLYDLLD